MVLSSQTLADGIYKWTDSDGRIHYGDHPATGTSSKNLKLRPTPLTDPQQAQHARKRDKLLRIMEEERSQKKALQEQQKQQHEKQLQACKNARKRLYEYEHASYLYHQNQEGKHVILSDEEHSKALDEANKAVARSCP